LWNIAPINPLCLEDTSLSWLLTTTEGSQDVSAHALSSYIMLTQCTYHIPRTHSTLLSTKYLRLTANDSPSELHLWLHRRIEGILPPGTILPLPASPLAVPSRSPLAFGRVQAYLQLEALSVEPDYDIAAALLPLSWWCRFYSANEAEGHQKEVYCVTVGAKICESVGAINDATYSGLIKYAAFNTQHLRHGQFTSL
jgi:hypothetical protein